jgi:hypothetical protein
MNLLIVSGSAEIGDCRGSSTSSYVPVLLASYTDGCQIRVQRLYGAEYLFGFSVFRDGKDSSMFWQVDFGVNADDSVDISRIFSWHSTMFAS